MTSPRRQAIRRLGGVGSGGATVSTESARHEAAVRVALAFLLPVIPNARSAITDLADQGRPLLEIPDSLASGSASGMTGEISSGAGGFVRPTPRSAPGALEGSCAPARGLLLGRRRMRLPLTLGTLGTSPRAGKSEGRP